MIDRKKWFRIYEKLPEAEKRMPAIIIDGEPFNGEPCSWSVINLEVRGNTKLSKRMLKQLSRMEELLNEMETKK